MDLTLVQQARDRLSRFAGRYPEIARDYGLAYSWITKFAQGRVANPTVSNLSKLLRGLDQLEAAAAAGAPPNGPQPQPEGAAHG